MKGDRERCRTSVLSLQFRMDGMSDWIPFLWPDEWQDSALLDLLKGTPINCLILKWADPAGQQQLKPVVGRARAAGLALVALVGTGADRSAAVASAQAAGFSAVASDAEVQGGFPVVWWTERSQVPWAAPGPVLAIAEGVWPGIPLREEAGAGPTGMPWVDSNGWFVQLARARAPSKTIWVVAEPPEKDAFLRSDSYALAVADAEVYGARWVISLAERQRAGLVTQDSQAVDAWKKLSSAIEFFEAHRNWRELRLISVAAVISDFSGENEFLSGEILNLLARRPLAARIIEKGRWESASWEGLKAIIYPDPEPPSAELRAKLLTFVKGGGLLVAGPKWPPTEGTPANGDPYKRYQVRRLGKGRLAVAKEETQDPYEVARDTHLLLGHRNNPLQFFNAASMNSYYTITEDRKKALVQIVNYSMRPAGHPVSVKFPERYRAARLWTLESKAPAPLGVEAVDRGVEIHLPPFSVYAAIELEK